MIREQIFLRPERARLNVFAGIVLKIDPNPAHRLPHVLTYC
jgi:hypothetical protein